MDTEQMKEYRALCRGTATYILLGGHSDHGMTIEEIAVRFAMDPSTVLADVNRIVSDERHKRGGVFEMKDTARGEQDSLSRIHPLSK